MAAKKNAAKEAAAELARKLEPIIAALEETRAEIDQSDRQTAMAHVRYGRLIADLRAKAPNGTWGKQLEKLSLHPRHASRYRSIGDVWPFGCGIDEAGYRDKLPGDVAKLVALSKVPLEKLTGLLDGWDPRTATR